MEGVSYSKLDCLNLIKELSIVSNKVVLSEGGARSELYKQITADIFDTVIVNLNVEEGPSFGTTIIAGVGARLHPSAREVYSSTPLRSRKD